jgi:hypothetical protein
VWFNKIENSLNLKFKPYNISWTGQTRKDFIQASKIHSELLFRHCSCYSNTRGVTLAHKSTLIFSAHFCPHLCTPEKTSRSVTHSEIALGQARLTPEFFGGGFPKKKLIPWWYEYSMNPIKPWTRMSHRAVPPVLESGWAVVFGWYRLHYCPLLGPAGSSDATSLDWFVWLQIWPFKYEFDHLNWKTNCFWSLEL